MKIPERVGPMEMLTYDALARALILCLVTLLILACAYIILCPDIWWLFSWRR